MKLRRLKLYAGILALLAAGLNVAAYRQAYRMTHFAPAGERTKGPNQLSVAERIRVLVAGVSIPKPAIRTKPAGAPYRTVMIDDRLEVWDVDGDGEVVVMFPGHAVAKSALLGEAAAYRELGCRCVLVDFRGCGGSAGSDCTLGWREASDVSAAVRWTRREHPGARLIVHGESMGAAAVLRAFAVEGLKADGVVLECPFDRLSTTIGHRNHAMGLPSFPLIQLLLFWGGVQHGFNPFRHNPVEYARSMTVPALVLAGENDPWVKPAEARSVAGAMRGPTTVRIFEGAGHGAYVWYAPEVYRHTLRDWLAETRVRWAGPATATSPVLKR